MKIRWMLSFFSVIVVGYLAAGQVIYLIHSNADVSTGWVNRRYSLAMKQFAKIHGHTVLFLGSSEVESGVKPNLFDQSLASDGLHATSYNFGFRNMSPRNLGDLIREMQFSRAADLKVDAVYIRFAPSDLTVATQIATEAVDDEVAANIFSNSYLLGDLTEANLKLLVIKHLQGGFTSVNLNESLRFLALQAIGRLINQKFSSWNELDVPRYKLWIERRYNAAPEWNIARKGFHDRAADLNKPDSENELRLIYEQQALPPNLKFNFAVQETRSGIRTLNLSPKLIAEFKDQLEALRQLTDNVVLFYVPDHPELPRTNEARMRVNALITELCKSSLVRCLRFDLERTFTAKGYYDTSHLKPGDVDKLTLHLAEDFKKMKAVNEPRK
ncbi:hypothetical protein BH10BDE1_BH10BDE1_16650 [soil metagenome]